MVLSPEEVEKRVADSYELPNEVLSKVPTPVVSIRTSTYNHGPYIRQCIEGVLMQKTTFPFEYIIGEDFSTDETREIVFEYSKKYPDIIRVVTADYNIGSKANGRRCIQRCRGEYIAICEGDDCWIDPYKLQKQIDLLEKNKDCSFCCGAFIRRQNGKEDIIEKIISKNGFFFFSLQDWGKEWITMPLTIVYRQDMLDDYQQKLEIYKYSRDIYLIYHLLKEGNGIYLSDILAIYHVHPGGICSMLPAALNAINNYNCYCELYRVNNTDEVLKYAYLNSISIRLVYPSKKDYSSKDLFLKGWRLSTTLMQKIKLLYYYTVPSFLILFIAKLKKKIFVKKR